MIAVTLYLLGMFACGMVYDSTGMKGALPWIAGLLLWPFYIALTIVILVISSFVKKA
jgi:hypothetical protein